MTEREALLCCVALFTGVAIGVYASRLLLRVATQQLVEEAAHLARAAQRVIDERRIEMLRKDLMSEGPYGRDHSVGRLACECKKNERNADCGQHGFSPVALRWRQVAREHFPCSFCHATAFVGTTPCRECKGTGIAPDEA